MIMKVTVEGYVFRMINVSYRECGTCNGDCNKLLRKFTIWILKFCEKIKKTGA